MLNMCSIEYVQFSVHYRHNEKNFKTESQYVKD